MIDPLPHQVGKTAAMLKLETRRADPSGAVRSLSAQALGRLDPKSSLYILPPFLTRRKNEGHEGPRSVTKLKY